MEEDFLWLFEKGLMPSNFSCKNRPHPIFFSVNK